MHNADEESIGAAATLVVDPEISRSQDSRSMLAILPCGGKRGRSGWWCYMYGEDQRRVARGKGVRMTGARERRETAAPTRRYEGMDLDLKGGTTWKEGVEGSEVG